MSVVAYSGGFVGVALQDIEPMNTPIVELIARLVEIAQGDELNDESMRHTDTSIRVRLHVLPMVDQYQTKPPMPHKHCSQRDEATG